MAKPTTTPPPKRNRKGALPKGNQYWKLRKSFASTEKHYSGDDAADQLSADAFAYFDWVRDNPIISVKLVSFQGVSTLEDLPKRRLVSIMGICAFIGITDKTWRKWRNEREDLKEVISTVEAAIFAEQLEGAASETVNPMIVARLIGLKEKTATELTGPNGAPLQMITSGMDPKEAAEAYANTLSQA